MKNIFYKILKALSIGVVAIILVTVGIDASDNYNNMSESIVGRIFFGASEGPCSKDMVFVPTETNGFCIDKYEASPSQECLVLNVASQIESRDNLDRENCRAESAPDKIPWRFISQTQAQTACAKAGKRLPSDEEWYLASLGTPDLNSGWSSSDCQVSVNWMKQPGETGSGEKCVSSYGSYDMIGNVWEWVKGEAKEGVFKNNSLPKSGYIKAVNSEGLPIETVAEKPDPNFNEDYFWLKDKGARGLARGGYWDNKTDAGVYAIYLVSPPNFAGTGIGFRCAK